MGGPEKEEKEREGIQMGPAARRPEAVDRPTHVWRREEEKKEKAGRGNSENERPDGRTELVRRTMTGRDEAIAAGSRKDWR